MGFFSGIFGSKKEPEPTPPPSLTSILQDEIILYQPLLLRPSSPIQKTLMIEGVIRARREIWDKGGYILTGSQDSAEVVRVLKESNIEYKVYSMSTTHEHNLLSSLTAVLDDQVVRVYVDDENAPFGRRNDDYKRFIGRVIEQCRKWREGASREGWRYLPVFYLDLPFANTPGYSGRMWDERQHIGCVVLTSKTIHDREIAALGTAFSESEEFSLSIANSVIIYGAGRRNHSEVVANYEMRFASFPHRDAVIEELRQESTLGIYFPGGIKTIDLNS